MEKLRHMVTIDTTMHMLQASWRKMQVFKMCFLGQLNGDDALLGFTDKWK
jgi:hypothetical protein